ncbi:MAG: EamA family transporter [Leptolinea sp.]|jgi:drug/metabolite transporter (DMT)-like permease|nr:EamA family transporter [Leptolinea sp.]
MLATIPSKRNAIIMAAVVTTIWSTSWIFIKIGLQEIPALPFATLRYFFAFLILLPWLVKTPTRQVIRAFGWKDWLILAGLSMLTYPLNQGGLFVALSYLPNTTVSLLQNFSPVFIALLGSLVLKETVNRTQYLGMTVLLSGALVFFLPLESTNLSVPGLIASLVTLFSNVVGSVYGRKLLRAGTYPVIIFTGVCMGIGSVVMMVVSHAWEWIPRVSLTMWGILVFLSVVNTALAFNVWNTALQRLTAFEANIINNTMLVQIAILSWIFLGDVITWKMAVGMLLVMGGAVLVNLRGSA